MMIQRFHYLTVFFLGLVCILVGLDLGSKSWARAANITTHGPTEILPFLSLVLAFNPSVTFGGVVDFAGPRVLDGILVTVCLSLFVWLLRERSLSIRIAIAFALAGALGNTVDRLLNGMVTDFLELHFGYRSHLVINLADVWIMVGLGALLLMSQVRRKQ
jgi:signal peptidase II